MKAAILQTPGHLNIVDRVIDKPAPHEVLLQRSERASATATRIDLDNVLSMPPA